MMKVWKMSCIIHPILYTSIIGDINVGFNKKTLWSSRNHEASFFQHAETRLRAQFVRGLASRAVQSFTDGLCRASGLPKGHALWRGAPSSTCLHGRVRCSTCRLGGHSTNWTIFGTLVTYIHIPSFELEADHVVSASTLPHIFIVLLLHSPPLSMSPTPQPCPEKVHQDVAEHMVISCGLTISKGNGLEFLRKRA